jgi:hypothetical protein
VLDLVVTADAGPVPDDATLTAILGKSGTRRSPAEGPGHPTSAPRWRAVDAHPVAGSRRDILIRARYRLPFMHWNLMLEGLL